MNDTKGLDFEGEIMVINPKTLKNEYKTRDDQLFLKIEPCQNRYFQKNKESTPSENKEESAQKGIPFLRVYPDGLCKETDDFYSKTIMFDDINYQLAENEDKTAIFEGWCNFLNYFDTSIEFQFSFLNITGNEKTFQDSIAIAKQEDDVNSIWEEYSDMLKKQLAKGNNGILKWKYLTFGIHPQSLKKPKRKL